MLRSNTKEKLALIHHIVTDYSIALEHRLLEAYREVRVHGEWFALTSEQVEEIKRAKKWPAQGHYDWKR